MTISRTLCCAFVTLTAVLVLAAPLTGQSVGGVVTMADGITRAAGVIVAANGDSGAPVRALTNQRGEFAIQLRAPGRYTLRALRVGFRPTEGPTITVAQGATVRAQIQLSDVAVSLSTVTVQGDDVCRTSPDSGALVARAWEEARKAIMSAGLSATDAPLTAEWIEYNRTLEASGRIVRGLRVRTTKSVTTHAFKSMPADVLAEKGYVIAEGEETSYHAPDGDVLLSDAFASTHCFQVVAPARGADSLIGVAFRPARDRRDVRDIEGTFWLDRQSAELKWMDYSYTSMPSIADKATPGGRVEFLKLGNGGWLIGKWNIRMPEFGRALASASASIGRMSVVRAPNTTVLRAIQVTGGQVTKVLRGDTVVYQAPGAALDLRLVARDRGVPADRGTVELLGTDYVATADATGRARIAPVLEGRYEMRVRTPLMDTLRVAPITREVDVTLRARSDSVRLPSTADLLKAVCRDSAKAGEGLVRGLVRDTLGNPLADLAVIVTWQGQVKINPDQKADRIAFTEHSLGAMTDSAGRWRVCGVPFDVPLVARVRTERLSDGRRLRLTEDQPLGAVDLVPHAVATTTDIVLPKMNRALVEFSVVDEEGMLLSGTALDVEVPDGGMRTLNIGPNGRALIPDVAPGRITVRARKIGYLPGKLVVSIAAGRNTVPIIMSPAGFPTLDTVRIVGDERRRNDRFDEFDTRRLNGSATRSITRAEIEKRNPVDAWQMLTNLPSVKIAQQGGVIIARSMRVENARLLSDAPCYMKVMVDGVLMAETETVGNGASKTTFANLAHLPPPDQIRGIEVFAGPASIPVQYSGPGNNKWCGLIAVWTR